MLKAQIDMVKHDSTYKFVNKSRKTAMNHVWLFLTWLLIVAVESLIYSSIIYTMSDQESCAIQSLDIS